MLTHQFRNVFLLCFINITGEEGSLAIVIVSDDEASTSQEKTTREKRKKKKKFVVVGPEILFRGAK